VAFDKACTAVGITGLVPHGLRHTTASLAIDVGANVKVVRTLLGHATAAMTLDRYAHLLSDDLAGVADAPGKAIASTAVSVRCSEADSIDLEDKAAAC
jgi:integrase